MFELSITTLLISQEGFSVLQSGVRVTIVGSKLCFGFASSPQQVGMQPAINRPADVELTERDQQLLAGDYGPAAKLAMDILVGVAEMQGAAAFLDVSQSTY